MWDDSSNPTTGSHVTAASSANQIAAIFRRQSSRFGSRIYNILEIQIGTIPVSLSQEAMSRLPLRPIKSQQYSEENRPVMAQEYII